MGKISFENHIFLRIVILFTQLSKAATSFEVKDKNLTNTINKLQNIGAALTIEDIDDTYDISMGWEGEMTPEFDYYYETTVFMFGNTITRTVDWHPSRTNDERKGGSGRVLCTALKNNIELPISAVFTLTVQYKPERASLKIHQPGDIIRGSTIQMTCSSSDKGNPIGVVKWTLNGDPMSGNDEMLEIPNVDSEHSGQWKCSYENEIDHGNESDAVNVEVKWKPEPASLTLEQGGNIIRGNTIQMKCSSSHTGMPPGEVKWTLNGDPWSGNDETLEIPNVRSEHSGQWRCFYENEIDSGDISDPVTVQVKWAPGQGILFLSDTLINQGQFLALKCNGDAGIPIGKTGWIRNANLYTITDTIELDILKVDPKKHNGTWSCWFMNELGNGTESELKIVDILLTPLPPDLELKNKTAVNCALSITPGINIKRSRRRRNVDRYNHANITWIGNGSLSTITTSPDISEYVLNHLEPDTVYNVSVFYNSDIGDGEPEKMSFTTKASPLLSPPSITRNLLSARIEMNIENPNSTSEIHISVCNIGETDTRNCNTEMTKEITVNFRERIYGSFLERRVNVTLYDNGVQVDAYADEIGPAVVVIVLLALAGIVVGIVIIVIVVVVTTKKKYKDKKKQEQEVEENIDPYSYSNPNNESRTGTGPAKPLNAPPIYSVVNKGKPLAPIAASPADGPVYSQVDWSKKNSRQSLKGLPMSKKAIDKITFSKRDGSIHMHLEVSKKLTGEIEIDVCREGAQSSKGKVPKQHFGGTKNVVMVLPIKETSEDRYTINMKFIVKGQMVQEVDLTYPYETNSVNVTVLNDAYVTSGTGPEMPTYSEVNKPKKKKKAAEEQPYEDVETKKQSSHNDRSTNSVSPSNAEVAVEGVPPHPPRKGTPKEGVMYAELDLNNSGPPRLLPRLGSKSPAHEPVVYADVRTG